jgi:hypothetical protein
MIGTARRVQAVIAVSLWGLAGGGSIIFLRVFRAFRVMRLFKKLQPMRKILISLGACVKPVLSAFVILFILASIYAQVRSTAPVQCVVSTFITRVLVNHNL